MATALDLPTLDQRADLLPTPQLLTQPQPALPWCWTYCGRPGVREPCPSITMARGLLASVGLDSWTWVNIDSGEEEGNPETPRFVAQVLGDAGRDEVMLELHTFDDLYVVAREKEQSGPMHHFSGDAAQIIPCCYPEEVLSTVEMLDVAIQWLCVGQIPDGYKLRPAHAAPRLGYNC